MILLILIFISVFASVGFQFAMDPGMILSFYKDFLEKVNGLKYRGTHYGWLIAKPLGYCITCSSHWIAFIVIFSNKGIITSEHSVGILVLLEMSCIAASGLSTLVWFWYNTVRNR